MSKIKSSEIIDWLSEKWSGRTCPMCGEGNWGVQDAAFELREYQGGSLVVGGTPIVPVIPITCGNCGNTILINAIVANQIDRGKEEEES